MNTPDATKPQPPVKSPTGEPFNPHYVVDLFGANHNAQTGGEAKTTDVPRFVPRVPIVPRTVAAPAGHPFPPMTGLQPGETPQVVLPTGSIMVAGGRKKRKSMKKKQTKNRKSMKKKKTMKRKSMKKRR
jgi:hypothetical protein